MNDGITKEEENRIRKHEMIAFLKRFDHTSTEIYRMLLQRWPDDNPPDWRNDWSSAFIVTDDDSDTIAAFGHLCLDIKSSLDWRIMVELCTRSFFAKKGRPLDATAEWFVSRALDFDEVRKIHLGGQWTTATAIAKLKTVAAYKDQYDYTDRHLGKLITKVTDEVGPIDDELWERLVDRYGEVFWDEHFRRNGTDTVLKEYR